MSDQFTTLRSKWLILEVKFVDDPLLFIGFSIGWFFCKNSWKNCFIYLLTLFTAEKNIWPKYCNFYVTTVQWPRIDLRVCFFFGWIDFSFTGFFCFFFPYFSILLFSFLCACFKLYFYLSFKSNNYLSFKSN